MSLRPSLPSQVPSDLELTDTGIALEPDHSRVIIRFFVPGREDVGPGDSRATPVIERVLAIPEPDVALALADIDERFGDRHRDLHGTFLEHAGMVTPRLPADLELSPEQLLFLGASFTHEYTIEGAALCNPCIVEYPHHDHGEGDDGDVEIVMSVRGIGEGHRSSIGFRTGRVTAAGVVELKDPGPFATTVLGTSDLHHQSVFRARLHDLDDDHENAAFVLDPLDGRFDDQELSARIEALAADEATRRNTETTIAHLRHLAMSSVQVEFPVETTLAERVLWPQSPAERHGMEDARFVRFTADDGTVTYYATYTAFDGFNISQHLLETTDFRRFAASPMAGAAAAGKGLALFPRRVGGRYVALSRADRESNAVAFSDDIRCWPDSTPIQLPERAWEIVQLGNCGSPIETTDGWLVLTHGVGPMRTYNLGAILLDLDDPSVLLASSAEPILTPGPGGRDGYVPNVVYSCGAHAIGDLLVLPYGIGDQSIGIATLSVRTLLDSLTPIGAGG